MDRPITLTSKWYNVTSMDLLKSHKRRSRLSDVAYISLNIGLAIALLVVVRYGQTAWLAIGIVLLSKWRALAVRPRFWFANLVANMVDLIVGVSVVLLLYQANGEWFPQIVLTVMYTMWLLLIKPRSKKSYINLQAGVAIFLGVTALASISYPWDSFFFVIFMWLIGFAAARHVLGSYDEPMTAIYSLIAGFVYAEIGWIGYHWLFAYALPGFGAIKIPQIGIILLLSSLAIERGYSSNHRHGSVRRQDVLLPVLLAIAVTLVLFVFYNRIALIGTA